MTPTPRAMPPGYLVRTTTDDGMIRLLGPDPGPAGEAGLLVAPGLFVCFDAADPRVVTRVDVDDNADAMDVVNLLGVAGNDLIDATDGREAFLDDTHAERVRAVAARLALLLLARTVPGPLAHAASWSFEALVLAAGVADYGFDQSDLLAAESHAAVPALLSALGGRGSLPSAEALVVRAAHVAHRALDPLDPAWFALHEAVSDLPDFSDDALAPAEGRLRPERREPAPVSRWRGAERLLVKSFPLLWSWVGADLRPPGAVFDNATIAAFDSDQGRVVVHCALPDRPNRAVFARLVERDSARVVSVFALLVDDGLWRGDGPLPPGADVARLRVEVVDSLGAAVLDDQVLLARTGTQWGLLALEAERTSDLNLAAARWQRCSEQFTAAGSPRRAAAAQGYAEACMAGDEDAELRARRAEPFESEMGQFRPEEL